MEGYNKQQGEVKVVSRASPESRVARIRQGKGASFDGSTPGLDRFTYTAQQRMNNHQKKKIWDIITEASILFIRIILAENTHINGNSTYQGGLQPIT